MPKFMRIGLASLQIGYAIGRYYARSQMAFEQCFEDICQVFNSKQVMLGQSVMQTKLFLGTGCKPLVHILYP